MISRRLKGRTNWVVHFIQMVMTRFNTTMLKAIVSEESSLRADERFSRAVQLWPYADIENGK